MTVVGPQLILELTPFISTILIELASSGGEGNFDSEFKKTQEFQELKSKAASITNIQNTALLSFHFEQSMRYFDFATIAAFVIFLTKLYTTDTGGNSVVVAGVISVSVIIFLRVWTRRYFESKTPNEYARKEPLIELGHVEIRKGDGSVILANMIPVICLVSLEYI